VSLNVNTKLCPRCHGASFFDQVLMETLNTDDIIYGLLLLFLAVVIDVVVIAGI
jgi:hypothetical protein